MPPRATYLLYFDESGTFDEPSPARASGQVSRVARGGRGASQQVGLLVPVHEGNGEYLRAASEAADGVLASAYGASGFPDEWVVRGFHATDILRRAATEVGFDRKDFYQAYGRLLEGLLHGVQSLGWQPVRIVNRELVGFGDRFATYANVAAELIVQVLEVLETHGAANARLEVFPARYYCPEQKTILAKVDYERRIAERISFCAVRRGRGASTRADSVSVRLVDARTHPVLQVCDILSHASFRAWHHAKRSRWAARLRKAFGSFDFDLQVAAPVERLDQLIAAGLYGFALRDIVEACADPTVEDGLRRRIGRRRRLVLDRLAGLAAPARNPHLAELVSWLEQIVAEQRASERGLRAAGELRSMADALGRRVEALAPGSVDWFRFACRRWELTAANHSGQLVAAVAASRGLDDLLPRVAGRWEHASLITGAMVVQAVHLTDVFEPERAGERCAAVVRYYESLRTLFHDAMPDVFPRDLRSDQLGKALGTWLQAAWVPVAAGSASGDTIAQARSLSERAIAEFGHEADRRQQFQYRAQFETYAGDYVAARTFLARSLGNGAATADHGELAPSITSQSGIGQAFAATHWLRIGVYAAMEGATDEADALVRALRDSGGWRLCASIAADVPGYPVHSLCRFAAALSAWGGAPGRARQFLAALRTRQQSDGFDRPILSAIYVAALVETAGFLWSRKRALAYELLGERDGALRVLLDGRGIPVFGRGTSGWAGRIRSVLKRPGDGATMTLHSLSRSIAY